MSRRSFVLLRLIAVSPSYSQKKPITQLKAASALNRILVLCDGTLTLLNMFDLEVRVLFLVFFPKPFGFEQQEAKYCDLEVVA